MVINTAIENATEYLGVQLVPISKVANDIGSYDYVCKLNQVNMIAQLDKMPTYIFFFLLASFIGFMLHFHLEPRIKKYDWFGYLGENNFLGLAYVMLGSALTLSFFWTFKIDDTKWFIIKIILAIWFVIFIVLLVKKLYQNYFKVRLNHYGFDLSNPDFSKVDFKKLMDDLKDNTKDLDGEEIDDKEKKKE